MWAFWACKCICEDSNWGSDKPKSVENCGKDWNVQICQEQVETRNQKQLRSLTQLTTSSGPLSQHFSLSPLIFSARFKSQSFGVAVKFNKSITRFFTISCFFGVFLILGIRLKESSFFTSIHSGDIPNFSLLFFFLLPDTHKKRREKKKPEIKKSL